MQEHDELTPADRELVESLRSLAPAAVRIDPVAAAYAAGRRSARNQLRRWRAAAALLFVVAMGSWWLPAIEGDRVANRPKALVASHPPARAALPPAQSLVALRYAVYEGGINALPATPIPASRKVETDDLL